MGFGTLVQRITYKVSGRSSSSSGLFVPSTNMYDYALGGIPLLSATNDTRPDTEKPVQQRKQQFDNYKDPGEYSLNQWWLRSQTSFVGGAGVKYQDPDTSGVNIGTSANIRYNKSLGVDPFTDPDILQLLREVNRSTNYVNADTSVSLTTEWFDNTGSGGTKLWILDGNGNVSNATVGTSDISVVGTATIPNATFVPYLIDYSAPGNAPAFDGTHYLFAYSDNVANGGLWRVTDGSMATTKIYTRFVSAFSLPVKAMALARGSIFINVGPQLYALDPNAAPATAWPATPVATVPVDQTIISITDGPDAVYVAANDSTAGYIYKTTFSATGVVNGLTLVAIMPKGERINCIAAYVATYLIITTMTGIRVGEFTGNGIQYGSPLTTVPPESLGLPGIGFNRNGFGRIRFYGSKAYISTQTASSLHDGAQGTVAIDLSTVLSDATTRLQFNPYSTWVYSPSSTEDLTSLSVTGDGRIIYASIAGSGPFTGSIWVEHATSLISSGHLDTGRCRFNTVEPKLFKFFSIRTPVPLDGNLTVAVLGDDGSTTNYVTYGPTQDPGTADISTPVPTGPRNYESLRFILNRSSTNNSIGAKLDSWQIKALPGTLKQRMITRNFLCFNSMKDKSGQTISSDSQALDTLTAIRQMCQRGDTVTFQDLVNNISDQVIIDDYQYTMLAPPGPNRENYGGYLTVMMRTVADSVPPLSLAGTTLEE